jgi:hypothetical protein
MDVPTKRLYQIFKNTVVVGLIGRETVWFRSDLANIEKN